MNKKGILPMLLGVLMITTLACTIPGITKRVQDVQETAQSVVTQAAPLIETAQSIATNAPDLLETTQAFATENADVVTTLQSVVTANPLGTLEAAITENLGGGTAPVDIPVLDADQISNLIANEQLVSFTTNQSYQDVLAFYQEHMVEYGWEANSSASYQLDNVAVLVYEKPDRQATVNITTNPINNSTTVIITIQE